MEVERSASELEGEDNSLLEPAQPDPESGLSGDSAQSANEEGAGGDSTNDDEEEREAILATMNGEGEEVVANQPTRIYVIWGFVEVFPFLFLRCTTYMSLLSTDEPYCSSYFCSFHLPWDWH